MMDADPFDGAVYVFRAKRDGARKPSQSLTILGVVGEITQADEALPDDPER